MKKLIVLLIPFIFLACEIDEVSNDLITENYTITVSGNCPFVSIDDEIYHGLYSGIDYVKTGQWSGSVDSKFNNTQTISLNVQKHTDDATAITATFEVEDVTIDTQASADPYGFISVSHTFTNQ